MAPILTALSSIIQQLQGMIEQLVISLGGQVGDAGAAGTALVGSPGADESDTPVGGFDGPVLANTASDMDY